MIPDLKQEIIDYFKGNYLPFYEKYFKKISKSRGDEYTALCLFHDDNNPSFSFNACTGVSFCHACGFKGDMFKVYSELNGLNGNFPQALKGIANDFGIQIKEGSNGPKKSNTGKIVSTYDYVDPDGNLIFQVVRYEPKDFKQRRPNGNGGWIWNLTGVEPVLYRLPEVIKAYEVWICEGEKDADNLAALGFTASTCPGGAGKWRKSYNQYLAGKDIIILPDNDKPGREHAEKIARSLYE